MAEGVRERRPVAELRGKGSWVRLWLLIATVDNKSNDVRRSSRSRCSSFRIHLFKGAIKLFFWEIYSKVNQFSVIHPLICSWPTSQSMAFFTQLPAFGSEPEYPCNRQDVEVYFPSPLPTISFFKMFSFGRRKMFARLSHCTAQITPKRLKIHVMSGGIFK